jgi:aminoglycoside phosphotransferase (APT) family kinase protein
MQMLAAAPALCAAGVQLARVAAFVPELPMVFQEPVAGMPLDLILSQPRRTTLAWGAGAWAGIQGAAEALAALHQGDTSTSRMRPVAAELERMQRRSERIMQVDPTIGAALNDLAQALPVWLDRLPDWGAESCLVHGDCKPSQFLITLAAQGNGRVAEVALLDFDHCGMADPAADVGNFLASLRQAEVAQALRVGTSSSATVLKPLPVALEEEFLTSYLAARCCPPDLRLRATWYQAMALLRKALRSFARSPHSPLAALLVREAWRSLATLPGSD